MNDWPLQESDISEDVCKRCALCCSMDLRPGWADPRMMDALKVMVEKSPDIEFTGQGIRIQCSHLRKTKVSNVVANEFGSAPFTINDHSYAKISTVLAGQR